MNRIWKDNTNDIVWCGYGKGGGGGPKHTMQVPFKFLFAASNDINGMRLIQTITEQLLNIFKKIHTHFFLRRPSIIIITPYQEIEFLIY